ncbi:MAG TPA: sulfate ABC transporter permease subunit CysT, partial [Thermoanaerobaculia bacterium]
MTEGPSVGAALRGRPEVAEQGAHTGAPLQRRRRLRGGSVLPGFGLSLGFTLLYLGLLILIPLSTVFLKSA